MSRAADEDLPIWARPAPGERRPAYSRERIAQAALAIADREGFEAVTMRRVAMELGAGTMTLYHYVRNKDELASLMDDALMGELLVPADELADDWREALAQVARRSYGVFKRHPWLIEHLREEDERGPGGPNALRHFEQSLAAATRTGVDVYQRFEIVGLVDDYVFGHAMRSRGMRTPTETEHREEHIKAMLAYLEAMLATGEFPHIAEIAGDDIRASFERLGALADDEQRFERGLQRLLDGIELDLRRRQPPVEG